MDKTDRFSAAGGSNETTSAGAGGERKAGGQLPLLTALLLLLLLAALCVINAAELNRMQNRLARLEEELARTQTELAQAQLRAEESESEAQGAGMAAPAPRGVDYDFAVRAVAHRGLSVAAPENTLPAFRLAGERGFAYVETDIQFTADGRAVCLHDATVDRTSNGSGAVSEMSFEQLRQLDFGAWKAEEYAGTPIPTFEEFLLLCRSMGIRPYVELKPEPAVSAYQVQSLVELAKACGMADKITWISFSYPLLAEVRNCAPEARLGYLVDYVSMEEINRVGWLRSGGNEVFLDSGVYDEAACRLCREYDVPLEVWTIDSEEAILALDPYISGVTSNSLIAGEILYRAAGQD